MDEAAGFFPATQDGFVAGQVEIPEAVFAGLQRRLQHRLAAFVHPGEFVQAASPGNEAVHVRTFALAKAGAGLGGMVPTTQMLVEDQPELQNLLLALLLALQRVEFAEGFLRHPQFEEADRRLKRPVKLR